MAEQFIEKTYRYAMLVTNLRQAVELIRVSDTQSAYTLLSDQGKCMIEFCQACIEGNYPETENFCSMVKHIYEEETDPVVVGDILENAIIPMAEKIIQSMGNICQQLDEEYILESTATGYLTLKNIPKNIYLHSNNDPMWEARKQIRTYGRLSARRYAILGCGLGYHAYQLYLYLKGSVKICIYEENPAMVEYARKYGVLGWIPGDVLEIVTEDSLLKFLKEITDDETGFFMNIKSIHCIKKEADRNVLLTSYINWHSTHIRKEEIELNLWRNLESDAKRVKDFDSAEFKEEIAVVAAGPSLDENLERLKSWQGKKTIIAVGTVFRKLIRAGIRPDLVMICDPTDLVARQINGVEEEKVPLFLNACANFRCARRYKGPKYLFFSAFCKDAVEYAQKHDQELFASGGTVTANAIMFAVKFHAKAVYLVGVDLAFPGGLSHASDTLQRHQADVSRMRQIPGVGGQTVYADDLFVGYRENIENYIQKHQEIRWYNLSAIGAHIGGTIEIGNGELPQEPTALPPRKLSIIIPCHNAEENLERCVESLSGQTLPKEMLELIFVENASKDSTGKILKRYEQESPGLIKVIKMETNIGPGGARNAGLKAVKGDYIGFVDADDYLEPEMYETLYRMITNTGAEIAECGRFDENAEDQRVYHGPNDGGILDLSEEAYANEAWEEVGSCGLTQRLYRRDFVEKIRLRFPEGITSEDDYFVRISNYYTGKIVASQRALYHKTDKTASVRRADRLKIEVMKVEELRRRGAYEYNRDDIEMQFLRHFFAETMLLYGTGEEELPEGLLTDMQDAVKKMFPDWRQNVLLQERQNERIWKICGLIDYPFKRGDLEELREVLMDREILEEKAPQ